MLEVIIDDTCTVGLYSRYPNALLRVANTSRVKRRGRPYAKLLISGAVPSIFAWNDSSHQRRPPRDRQQQSVRSRKVLSEVIIDAGDNTNMDMDWDDKVECQRNDSIDIRLQQAEKTLRIKEEECRQLKQKNADLNNQLYIEKFGVNRFSADNSLIRFYTGFRTYTLFYAFFTFIQPSALNMQSAYYCPSELLSLAGRPRSMLLIDEFFMFLCRLRAGLQELDPSVCFNCHISSVSRKLITWDTFLYVILGSMPIWPSRYLVDRFMPKCFRLTYPSTRVTIDCIEIKTQYPSSMNLNSKTYSHYKSSNTFKCILGIAPHGTVTCESCLYTGCMSDVAIVQLSGMLDLLEPGDSVMADKGFTIGNKLSKINVGLNIPPFLHFHGQFNKEEIQETETIASLRIHVERAIRRVKEHLYFDSIFPLNLVGSINLLWTVAILLTNYEDPLFIEK